MAKCWLLLLFLPFLSPTTTTSATSCHPDDLHALRGFAGNLTGDGGVLLREAWASSGPSCCGWEGVGCDAESGRVTTLSLPGRGLRGPVPGASLAALAHLSYLDLSGNSLVGEVPTTGLQLPLVGPIIAAEEPNTITGTNNRVDSGTFNTLSGNDNTVMCGDNNTVSGSNNTILGGSGNAVSGSNQVVCGWSHVVTENNNAVTGHHNTVTGSFCTVSGHHNTVSGSNNTVSGSHHTVTGSNKVVTGGE